MNWELIWKVVFIGLLLAFAVMSVFVIFHGARDIRRLLSELGKDARNLKDRDFE